MPLELIDNRMCYVCGEKNLKGLRLQFEHPEPRLLKAQAIFSEEHQGFKGIVHGGMIAMVLDEMMVNLAWIEGIPAVTAELSIRLKKPSKTGQIIHFEGHLLGNKPDHRAEGLPGSWLGKTLYASATAKTSQGEILATAKGTCIRIDEIIDQKPKGS